MFETILTSRPQTLESTWTQAGPYRMHARVAQREDAGSVPVVLVHGLGVSSRYMIPAALELAEFSSVYAPDLPGFGRSGRPPRTLDIEELSDALVAWMDAVGLGRAALVGNSLGCQIIVDAAVRHPQYVLEAVLLNPSIDANARTVSQQFMNLLKDSPREPPSQLLLALFDYLECGPVRFWQTLQYGLQDRIEDKLPQMRCPTLVVRGELDPLVSQEWAEEVCRRLPRGRLVVIPGASHTANYSDPEAFVDVVRPFLQDGASRI